MPLRALLLVVLGVALSMPAEAQRRGKRFAEKGDVALVASIRSLDAFQLGEALGGVGLRYRLADQTALGVSVGGNWGAQELNRDGLRTVERSTGRAQGSLWLEQHLGRPRRALSPFVGFGSQVRYVRSESEQSFSFDPCGDPAQCDVVIEEYTQEVEEWRAGVAVLAGAEVRLAGGVTLGAAYTLGGGYSWSEVRSEDVQRDDRSDQTSRGPYVGTGISEVMLSVYF